MHDQKESNFALFNSYRKFLGSTLARTFTPFLTPLYTVKSATQLFTREVKSPKNRLLLVVDGIPSAPMHLSPHSSFYGVSIPLKGLATTRLAAFWDQIECKSMVWVLLLTVHGIPLKECTGKSVTPIVSIVASYASHSPEAV